jgi:hypothetical protein
MGTRLEVRTALVEMALEVGTGLEVANGLEMGTGLEVRTALCGFAVSGVVLWCGGRYGCRGCGC